MTLQQNGFNPSYSEAVPTPEQVSTLDGEALLEFGAPWCGHCIAAEPAVQEAFIEHENLPRIKTYDGKGKPLGRAFRVKLWPTLIKLQDGQEVARLVRPLHADDVRKLLLTTH